MCRSIAIKASYVLGVVVAFVLALGVAGPAKREMNSYQVHNDILFMDKTHFFNYRQIKLI